MIIKTQKRENPYAQIDRSVFEDSRLSWRSKGILGYLLSKPENWWVRCEDVLKHATEGRDAVRVAMKELSDVGYAKLVNGPNGREWHIFETPQKPCPEKPSMAPCPEKPCPEKANMAKSATSNKDISVSAKEESNSEFSLQADESQKINSKEILIPDILNKIPEFKTAWNEFVETRKKKKKALTPRASTAIFNRLMQRPSQVMIAMDAILEFGWLSFEWEWEQLRVRLAAKPSIPIQPAETKDAADYEEFIRTHPDRKFAEQFKTKPKLNHDPYSVLPQFWRWVKTKKHQ